MCHYFSGSNRSHIIEIFIADEKASFTKEDMKVGKHIEYAESLLDEMCRNSQRCPTPQSSTDQENPIKSESDWFDIGSFDKQSDGEINTESTEHDVFTSSSESPAIEQTDLDDFQQISYTAVDDDDLG